MNHKSITPNPQQPVDRVPTGQLPSALAELSEAELSDCQVRIIAGANEDPGERPKLPNGQPVAFWGNGYCSYDGDDE
jgi:bacteriocin leader peptide (microcyclamide/patellamide family)